jgi:predicted nucleic acid-binding Zn ribbon protein
MQPLGHVLNKFLKSTKWKSRLDEIKIKNDWPVIVGKTIAKYTKSISYYEGVLIIYTDVAPLKQEIMLSKQQLIITINEHFNEAIIKEIQVR